jgi:UDP-2,3-diacylglucosamine pyrophosphatase LpxH
VTTPRCHRGVTRQRCNAAMSSRALPPATDEPTHQFRTLWLSDVHLGTRDCKAGELLGLLRECDAPTLYLVGDIIDGWQLRRGWYWPQAHNDVVQKLLRKARKGCRVIFVPGNHDEFARHYAGLHFGGIEVLSDVVHETAAGARLWVVHGDWFDGVVMHAKWLAHLGDVLYILSLKLNRWLNQLRHRLGFSYWSLSQYLKGKVKNAVSYISNFEQLLAEEAARRQCAGVVCGHIHRAELRGIGATLYANCGDWVESLTAVAERHDGTLALLQWIPSTASVRVVGELKPGAATAPVTAPSPQPCAS